MNHYYFIFLLLFSGVSLAQTEELASTELCADFDMILVDYEVYNGNVVAVTKKRGDYFIYYTSPSGEKISQEFKVFFPTDLEIDSKGELVLTGLDSTYVLSVGDAVVAKKVAPTQNVKGSVPFEVIDFPNTQVHVIEDLIVFKDQNGLKGANTIKQIVLTSKSSTIAAKEPSNRMKAVASTDQRDLPLERNTPEGVQRNDFIARPSQAPVAQLNSSSPGRARMVETSISFHVMKQANCLWLVNETDQEVSVYSETGLHLLTNPIANYPYKSKMVSDPVVDAAYFIQKQSPRWIEIIRLNQDGSTTAVLEMKKGLSKSDLKIRGGYLYYRTSKGKGESIERIKL